MSVLCTYIPDLLLTLTHQTNPQMVGKPVAVLDEDERITALSQEASAAGVIPTMSPTRAQLKCPEIVFQDVNLSAFTQTQAALLETLKSWQLPTEEAGWGLAYVDMHPLTDRRREVEQLGREMGGELRGMLGDSVVPCLGWDSGKFTAKAAAVRTQPGRMKLVAMEDEVPFLYPLPITLLPLPMKDLRWLNRLGIRTLGQFGELPSTQIQTALGKQGRAAQQWALGHDDRPVLDTVARLFEPIAIDLPHPTSVLADATLLVMRRLEPYLDGMARACRGVRRLELELDFVGDIRCLVLTFVEPTAQRQRIEDALTHQLQALNWPGYLQQMSIKNLQDAELPAPEQLGLFEEAEVASTDAQEWLTGLGQRFGRIRHRGSLIDPSHPVAHGRGALVLA